MLGNCATGRVRIVMAPTITIRIATTIATIGRLMKNFDIASSQAGLGLWASADVPGPVSVSLTQDKRRVTNGARHLSLPLNGSGFTDIPGLSACWPSTT